MSLLPNCFNHHHSECAFSLRVTLQVVGLLYFVPLSPTIPQPYNTSSPTIPQALPYHKPYNTRARVAASCSMRLLASFDVRRESHSLSPCLTFQGGQVGGGWGGLGCCQEWLIEVSKINQLIIATCDAPSNLCFAPFRINKSIALIQPSLS